MNYLICKIEKIFEIWNSVMINKNLSQYFSFDEFKKIIDLIGINNFILREFTQKLYLYNIEEIDNILKSNSFKLEQIYSDWEGNIFEDNDDNIILIAKK